ncbi:MAG: anthranilate synthase component I, partial [Pseudomonadota bacterium]
MRDDGYHAPAPDFSSFQKGYDKGQPQLVYRRFAGDLDTPVSAYLKLTQDQDDSFLLESVEGGENLGRYTTIGMRPDLIWRAQGQKAEINREAQNHPEIFKEDPLPTLASLKAVLEASKIDVDPELAHRLPPMAAGLF